MDEITNSEGPSSPVDPIPAAAPTEKGDERPQPPPPPPAPKGPAVDSVDPMIGSVIDERYEVERCIGQGAMGAVYVVRHLQLKKRFALKLINPSLLKVPQFVALFKREAFACSRLSHPNCLNVTDFNQTDDNTLYLVMDYIEGHTLAQLMENGPMPIDEALETTRQILLGLQHAHHCGIVHQDIKLENVMKVRRHDGHWQIIVLDFGMAHPTQHNSAEYAVVDNDIAMGTPQYMAPEQLEGKAIDGRTDLYATGVVLWRLLTCTLPYPVEDLKDILQAKLHCPAPSLEEIAPGVFPKSLAELLKTALARRPADRFEGAAQMLDALAEVETDLQHKTPLPTTFQLLHSWGQRAKTPKGVATLLLATALLGTGLFFAGRWVSQLVNETKPPSDTANVQISAQTTENTTSGPAIDAPTGNALFQAQILINEKKYAEAIESLKQLIQTNPKLARAHYLKGQVEVHKNRDLAALVSYGQAIELDETYRTDSRILQDVRKMTNRPSVRAEALKFVFEQMNESGLPILIAIANGHPNPNLRHQAIDYARQLDAMAHVDLVGSLVLDMSQTASCKRKAEIIDALAQVEGSKTLAALKRLRDTRDKNSLYKTDFKHACVRPQIIGYIKELTERAEPSADAGSNASSNTTPDASPNADSGS